MRDDKIDLSPLDPSRDTQRWNQLMDSIARRAIEARERRSSPVYQLLAWARPAAVAAVVAALIAVIGASIRVE